MAKTALYDAMREQGAGRAELARRLRWHLPQVSRPLDLRHASRMEQVEAALAALGLRLIIMWLERLNKYTAEGGSQSSTHAPTPKSADCAPMPRGRIAVRRLSYDGDRLA
jgi:hypothetical protein